MWRFAVLALFLITPVISQAQFADSETLPSLASSPAYPEPGQIATISIDNYLNTSYGAEITWYFNGAEIPNAENARSVDVQIGDVNSQNVIEAAMTVPLHGTRILKKVISPIYIDVIVEPQTHVPDFYMGRALPSTNSITNLTALIFGNSTARNDLVYTWRVNNQVVSGGGGRGQYRTSFVTPRGSEIIVSVEVSTLTGVVLGSRSFTIPNVRPSLSFYEVNTLYGVQQRELETFNLIGNSATILAEPYHLDSRVYNNPDMSMWNVDGIEVTNPSNPYQVTFERVGFNGTTELSFHVRNLSDLIQGVESSMKINY